MTAPCWLAPARKTTLCCNTHSSFLGCPFNDEQLRVSSAAKPPEVVGLLAPAPVYSVFALRSHYKSLSALCRSGGAPKLAHCPARECPHF